MILVNQMARYLVGSSDSAVELPGRADGRVAAGRTAPATSYMLFTPGDLSFPVSADLKRGELAITATDHVGNYRLQAGGTGGVDLGFSVNYAPEQTQLDRLNDEELAGMFGPVNIAWPAPATRSTATSAWAASAVSFFRR